MNERIERLRQESVNAKPGISIERALLVTEFYKEHAGRHSTPVLRALNFKHLCARKTIFIGPDDGYFGRYNNRDRAYAELRYDF